VKAKRDDMLQKGVAQTVLRGKAVESLQLPLWDLRLPMKIGCFSKSLDN
jgi:hypothetical protein